MSQVLLFPIRLRQQTNRGFSLIEMLVVLIIIGLFMTVGASKFVNKNSEMKSSVRRFSAMIKKLRNRARLDNKTYRLVFDLPVEKDKQQSYWVESTDKAALLLDEEQRKELDEINEQALRDSDQSDEQKKQNSDPQGFSTDTKVIKNPPALLPTGLYFRSIELDGDKIEEVTSGRVYIYFFPQGYVQGSAIQLSNREGISWTLIIEGLTGQVNILPKLVSLKDVKQE